MTLTRLASLALAIGLAGCAGYSRVTEYPAHLPRNYTVVHIANGRVFTVKEHPRDTTILIQATVGRAALAGLTGGLLGSGSTAAGIEPQYREAAEKFAGVHGCRVERLYPLGDVSYEAQLTCPPGEAWR